MRIQTVDPYLPQYVYVKQTNPDARIVWRQFREKDVQDVDRIVNLAKGVREEIKSQKDWEIFFDLLKFYKERWPDEFESFSQAIKDIRRTRRAKGYSQSKEIMYVGALPPRFVRIIRAIFPNQRFDKTFVWRMVRKVNLFKVSGENNLSKGGEIV